MVLRLFSFYLDIMRKKYSTLLSGLMLSLGAWAQGESVAVHSCNFDDGIPSTYSTYDLDQQTHHYTMVQVGIDTGVAWVALREQGNKSNRYAASTSKYKGTEVQPANDWLVTPRMRIMSTDAQLSWRANSVCENIQKGDLYEVRVSITGNRPEDFIDAPIAVVDGESINAWTERTASLGAYVGQDVHIAFVNRTEMGEILAIDDICVTSGYGSYQVVDAMGSHVFGSESGRISGILRSLTLDNITAFTAYCRVGEKVLSRQYTDIHVGRGEDFRFEFAESVAMPYGDTLRYQLWADIQGERSDTLDCQLVSLHFRPTRRTVVEEGTGMWCGWCPLGIIAMERMKQKYPGEFIGIATHYDDELEVEGYARPMHFSSYPSGWINRTIETVPMIKVPVGKGEDYTTESGAWETYFLAEQAQVTVADVDVSATLVDTEIDVNATIRFARHYSDGDFRLSFVVVEDNLEGERFYQTNYLNGLTEYTLDGFAEQPYHIFPFVFQDVARHLAGGLEGLSGSVPTSIVAGQDYTYHHRIAVPCVNHPEHVRIVALLLDANTGRVVNANQCVLTLDGIDRVGVDVPVDSTLYDLSGRPVVHQPRTGVYIQNGRKVYIK